MMHAVDFQLTSSGQVLFTGRQVTGCVPLDADLVKPWVLLCLFTWVTISVCCPTKGTTLQKMYLYLLFLQHFLLNHMNRENKMPLISFFRWKKTNKQQQNVAQEKSVIWVINKNQSSPPPVKGWVNLTPSFIHPIFWVAMELTVSTRRF